MGSVLRFAVVAVVFGYFAACAPVKFQGSQTDGSGKNAAGPDACPRVCSVSGKSCVLRCEVNRSAGTGLVDILVIDDNSGSMSTEQRRMGSRFPDFLNSISSLDYRIAITTTDISSAYSQTSSNNGPTPMNQYGKLQDGNLIEFSPGLKYITSSTPGKESLFINTIQRQETINCENSGFTSCPSTDERGIFAANLVLDRTAQEFFRPTAHLAVIVLSDEDERGISDQRSITAQSRTVNPLESYDLPETFVSKMKAKYPGKTHSVHSIVVKPGDGSCLAAQAERAYVWGYEGFSYAKLSQMTGGTVGTICSSDYGAQLGAISSSIRLQIESIPFYCRPIADQYQVTFTPRPSGNIRTSADFAKMQLIVEDSVPPSTKISLTYDCAIPNP